MKTRIRTHNMEQTSTRLEPAETWQTQARGTDCAEYEIYKACAESLGWPVKTFEDWIKS